MIKQLLKKFYFAGASGRTQADQKMNIVVLINNNPSFFKERTRYSWVSRGKNIPFGISDPDKNAIEAGLRLKDRLDNVKVVAMALGPKGKHRVLREALSLGCDKAIMVEDQGAFEGLEREKDISGCGFSKAIKRLGDTKIILTGNNTAKGTINCVTREVSERLNISQVDSVMAIEDLSAESITVKRKNNAGYDETTVPFPALLTIDSNICGTRVPTARDKIRARRKEIPVWSIKELYPEVNVLNDDKKNYTREQPFSPVEHEGGADARAEEYFMPEGNEDIEKVKEQVIGQNTEGYSAGDDNESCSIEETRKISAELPETPEYTELPQEDPLKENIEEQKRQKLDFLGYWGLTEKPFENTGSVRYFYYSPTHKEALVRLIYVIKQNKAGALLAGGYGTGKTTIARELLTELEQNDNYKSVYISNPLVNSTELLQEIAYQLGCDSENESRLILRRNITKKLEDISSGGDHTVILVDEAHLISRKDVLEELRLFMNLQRKEKFLTSIIMMGQLVLRDIINSMPQFKQRFAMYYILKQLDAEETRKYIKHRLKIAGTQKEIFTDEALSLIYLSSEGRPRQINNICDMALLIGHMRNANEIDDEMIREIVKDLGQEI